MRTRQEIIEEIKFIEMRLETERLAKYKRDWLLAQTVALRWVLKEEER